MTSETSSKDGERYKKHLKSQWNQAAPLWHRWTPMMRAQYAPATELMLDLADIESGCHILDVAAGDGYPSMLAAERVGSSGSVLAIDIAEEQLKFAEAAAERANLRNLETRLMDGENLDLQEGTFDAVICHFGMMFFPAPGRALSEMRRVLKRGGKLSTLNYAAGGSPESALASVIIRRHVGDEFHEPDRLSGGTLGAPGVLERMFTDAGFGEIEAHDFSLPLRISSAAEGRSYLQEAYPSLTDMIAPLSLEEREQVWEEIETALAAFESTEGLEIPNKFLIVVGTKS